MVAALLLAACASGPKPVVSPTAAAAIAAPPRPAWQARKVIADAVVTPQGRVHTVKQGETGIAIARAYGVPWDRLIAANQLIPPFVLQIGDKLLLPSTRQVAALSPEDRAKAFDVGIDDIITGGEPAAKLVPTARRRALPTMARGTASGTTSSAAGNAAPLPAMIGDTPLFHWPVEGLTLSGFGAKAGGRFNDGVNLKASAGAPIRAAAQGVVAYAGDAIPGFGNLILIKHANGWVTAYGHAEALLVTRGTIVSAGDVIARAGSTGAVSEPQVHFEIRRGRAPVDPARVIAAR